MEYDENGNVKCVTKDKIKDILDGKWTHCPCKIKGACKKEKSKNDNTNSCSSKAGGESKYYAYK